MTVHYPVLFFLSQSLKLLSFYLLCSRFDTEWKSRGCSSKFLVTHKQTEADMKIKWNRLSKYVTSATY